MMGREGVDKVSVENLGTISARVLVKNAEPTEEGDTDDLKAWLTKVISKDFFICIELRNGGKQKNCLPHSVALVVLVVKIAGEVSVVFLLNCLTTNNKMGVDNRVGSANKQDRVILLIVASFIKKEEVLPLFVRLSAAKEINRR